MRYQIRLIVLLSFIFAFSAKAEVIWTCHSKSFYTNPLENNSSQSIREPIHSPELFLRIEQSTENTYTASFEIKRSTPETVTGAPVEKMDFSVETLGQEGFQRALQYVSLMTNNKKIEEATSYTSYQVKRKNGETYVVALAFMKDGAVIARAILYPGGIEIIGVCGNEDAPI